MPNFCTQCGSEVNENFRFCPNCGAEVSSHPQSNEYDENKNVNEMLSSQYELKGIICDNCGEENPLTEKTCLSCGAVLKKSGDYVQKKKTSIGSVKSKTVEPGKVSHITKNKPKKKQTQPVKEPVKGKEIDSKKIILIAALLAAIAIVILLTSNVLDAGVHVTSNNTNTTQSSESGVDLNNIPLINELEAKLKSNPDDKETLLKLAHLQNDSRFYDKAIPLYQRYLAQVPSDADARIDMGVCYYNIHDYETAIKEIKTALTYKPDHQIGNLNLGIVNLAAGNMNEAMKWLQKTVDLGPETEIGKRAKELLNSHKQ